MKRKWAAFVLVLALLPPVAAEPDVSPTPTPAPMTGSPYDRGRNEANMGNWGRAAELFRQAVQANPKDHAAYNMLGYALRKTDKPREALEAYNRALAIKPDYAPALEYRGIAHLLLGNKKAAIEDYQALVKLGSPLAEDLKSQIDSAPAN